MSRDALESRYIDKCLIVGPVSGGRDAPDGLKLFVRPPKAFVASRNVIVDLDPIDSAGPGLLNDLFRIIRSQAIGADAHLVQPFSIRFLGTEPKRNRQQGRDHEEH